MAAAALEVLWGVRAKHRRPGLEERIFLQTTRYSPWGLHPKALGLLLWSTFGLLEMDGLGCDAGAINLLPQVASVGHIARGGRCAYEFGRRGYCLSRPRECLSLCEDPGIFG